MPFRLIDRVLAYLLMIPCHLWHLVFSPYCGNRCRYYPTCSQYATQALREKGAIVGLFYSVRRVCSCHPWSKGGYDPL